MDYKEDLAVRAAARKAESVRGGHIPNKGFRKKPRSDEETLALCQMVVLKHESQKIYGTITKTAKGVHCHWTFNYFV
ncbi:hypothetical protein [Pelosinus sp. sgz500959]|uniref:hypothetical protein n=1 Tax=Pelosinus sp. sgz500959 TaxID=3242472 RepID=UPI00366D0F66